MGFQLQDKKKIIVQHCKFGINYLRKMSKHHFQPRIFVTLRNVSHCCTLHERCSKTLELALLCCSAMCACSVSLLQAPLSRERFISRRLISYS